MVVPVYEITQRRALVTRGVAREFAEYVRNEPDIGPLTLDLDGVLVMAPGFFDELLGEISDFPNGPVRTIRIKNAPRPLAEKDRAVARGRHAQIEQVNDSEWEIRLPAPAPA
jgi:hypothetical protein